MPSTGNEIKSYERRKRNNFIPPLNVFFFLPWRAWLILTYHTHATFCAQQGCAEESVRTSLNVNLSKCYILFLLEHRGTPGIETDYSDTDDIDCGDRKHDKQVEAQLQMTQASNENISKKPSITK